MFNEVFNKKKVLITGHTGFKGSWLSVWLYMLGAEVSGFALPPDTKEDHFAVLKLSGRMNHIEGDIRDAEHILQVMKEMQPDFVFHLAAQSLVRPSYTDPKLTFDTNVGGSINVLEAVREVASVGALIFVTSDKCYRNREWVWGYKETDELGGRDPYSASKACAELAFSSYQSSFFNLCNHIGTASVRAGNVIGGGDWAEDRIIPDCVRALRAKIPINIRNPEATRPWQHVLEPLRGYLVLAEKLYNDRSKRYNSAWNFGPGHEANRSVSELVKKIISVWGDGSMIFSPKKNHDRCHEANLLHLNCDKANYYLGWKPIWNFDQTVYYTMTWYKNWMNGYEAWELTTEQVHQYVDAIAKLKGDYT